MPTQTAELTELNELPIPRQVKIAAAWTSFMFLYVYVDVLGLYKPGVVADILNGKVFTFDITQTFAVSALAAASIPTVMILLSTTLPARPNRLTNVIVAAILIPWMAFNLAGGEWSVYYGLGFAVELGLLAFILRSAWTWPRPSAASMPDAAAPRRAHYQMGR
ncbi:MAG: hypothetical protein IPL37_12985 [Austwickia sp.]|nr:hypothetical protein [Austwickia sp.]